MSAVYKLTYFDNRLRAEPIRWIFAIAKQPYEEQTITFNDWPTKKSDYLFGQLPVLEVNGKQLYQSYAITNYLAREFGLAGKSRVEQARANMIVLSIEDALYRPSGPILSAPDDTTRVELLSKYANDTLPFYLERYEMLLAENNEGNNSYFVGHELTYADLAVVSFVEEVTNVLGVPVNLNKYPKLAALKTLVETNEELAKWLEKRPKREKTFLEIVLDLSSNRKQQPSSVTMPTYKLTYFDNRLRAEPIRWLFAVAGQPYEDKRISFSEWPKIKADFLFGQLPVLEFDGQQLYQSYAIANYLAREFGLAGKTPLDQAQVNMIALTTEDALYRPLGPIINAADEAKQTEAIQKFASETLPFYLDKFEKILESNSGSNYLVGEELTYADLYAVSYTEEVKNIMGVTADLTKYPKLAALKARVESNDGLADWLSKRPQNDKTFLELLAIAFGKK